MWWVCLLLIGCTSGPAGFADGGLPDGDDDDATARPWITCPAGGCSAGVNVVPGTSLPGPCPDAPCVAEYLDFALAAAAEGTPVDPAKLEAEVLALAEGAAVPSPPERSAPELRSALIEATSCGFLFEGLDERELQLELVETVEMAWGREEHLVLRDPWIGSMSMVLLRPDGAGPFPGLVASPGHGEDWWDMRDAHFGDELADASWAVLIVDARASGADAYETAVTKALLSAGLSFVGVRVYEQLLARKVLRWRAEVHPELIGVWGHSGGSVVANLAVRIEDFAALVSDLQGEYLNVMPDGPWLDETSPAVHAWYPAINDLSTLSTPAYEDGYGYPDGSAPLRAFLRADVLGL